MCGRVTLTKTGIRGLASELDAEWAPDDERLFRPRYNVAPSDMHWMVEGRGDARILLPAVWGYPTAKRSLINVRGEQVASGAGFREAFRSRRCAVVTDGFFEWNARREPFWFHRQDGGLVLLAGLYHEGPDRPRFTVLTTRPNDLMTPIHDRMPVVLPNGALDDWLRAPEVRAAQLIGPAADDALVVQPVSKRVNSVKHDDPACLATPETPRQGSLF
ncbi:MAG TPA: SOS response-associated peptidase [Polyangia bacterium]|jgi:putative SOS response-associated peptidase YedK|nr:SOS response-associated peptidase [Polyangia bacterium]